MAKINQHNITEAVINHGDGGKRNPRMHEIYASFITHMHAFVKEINLNDDELEAARQWFSEMAKPNNDFPWGEVHLFSDLTGISELVRMMDDDANERGDATETNLPGPLYVPDAPLRENGATLGDDDKGDMLYLSGRVLGEDGQPLVGATVDIWQPNSQGYYDIQDEGQEDYNLRGIFTTNEKGEFWTTTINPLGYNVPLDGPCGAILHQLGRHGWRPAHIHFLINYDGYVPMTTMTYIDGAKFIDSDTVFSVKDALLKLELHDSVDEINERGLDKPFYTGHFDFTLESNSQRARAA